MGKNNTSLESAIGSSKLGFSVSYPASPIEALQPLNVNKPKYAFMPIRGIYWYLNRLSRYGENKNVVNPLKHEELNTAYLDKIPLIFNDESLLYQTHYLAACNAMLVMEKVGRLNELNLSLMANHIKSFQLEDGGFKSPLIIRPHLGIYSDLEATLQAVQSLELAQEEPLNKAAVRDYIYSLQDTTDQLHNWKYDFKLCHAIKHERDLPPSTHYTVLAALALQVLGFDLPYQSEIERKIKDKIDDFCSQFNTYSDKDKALFLFAFMNYSSIFNESEGKTIRDRLSQFALALHESLLPKSPLLNGTFTTVTGRFGRLLTATNMANPNLSFSIYPGVFNSTVKEQDLTLGIENFIQVIYKLMNFELEVIGDGKGIYIVHSSIPNMTLAYGDSAEHVITLQNLTDKQIDSIDLKLSFSTPMKNVISWENRYYRANIYFTLTNSLSTE